MIEIDYGYDYPIKAKWYNQDENVRLMRKDEILKEIEELASPSAEALSDGHRNTLFCQATHKLRPMLETLLKDNK
jgi:hypothetical protein